MLINEGGFLGIEIEREICRYLLLLQLIDTLTQAWAKLAPNIKLAPTLQPLLFEIMTRGLLFLTDNGQT
jgi:hypothetical protein